MKQRGWHLSSLFALLLLSSGVGAEDKPRQTESVGAKAQEPPPDAEFLEFLATWDSEEEGWNDFLVAAVAQREAKVKVKSPTVKTEKGKTDGQE